MPRPSNPHPYRVRIVRYVDAQGRRCKRTDPGAIKQSTQSETYYADLPGSPRTPLHETNLQLAWEALRRLQKRKHEEALGIRDETTEHAALPIEDHLERWIAVLEAKGTEKKQREMVRSRLLHLFELARWKRLPQISSEKAQLALAELQRPTEARPKGRSAQTRNHYLTHLRAFCAWCVDTGRLTRSPVRGLELVPVETDKRHERRAPTSEEVARLFAHLLSPGCPRRMGMTGRQRMLAYQIAMATGLRADELRSLGHDSFDLESDTVTLAAAYSKHRRTDTQPLPGWLVAELTAWFAEGGACWSAFPASYPGRLLKADLLAAGLQPMVEGPDGPLYWDMHSLRVWFVTELASQPGIDPKTLMTLARHSTPALSLKVYARAKQERLREAVDRLPPPSIPPDTSPETPQ